MSIEAYRYSSVCRIRFFGIISLIGVFGRYFAERNANGTEMIPIVLCETRPVPGTKFV